MNIVKRIFRKILYSLRLPFKKIGERRKLRILSSVASKFGTIKQTEKSGLIRWDPRQQRLFIAEPLATVQLAFGAERWAAFLNNVYLYNYYGRLCNTWERLINERTSKAVREAQKTNLNLQPSDLDRIRRQVLDSLTESDVAAPKLKPHEFYIIGDNQQVTLCGTYDPDSDQFDIVSWEEIQAALAANKNV